MTNTQARNAEFLKLHRETLFGYMRQLADLHMRHNVGDCRTGAQVDNHRLFYKGVEHGIRNGLDFFLEHLLNNTSSKPLALSLLERKNEVLELSLMRPYRAMMKWNITELDDLLDVERDDLIRGLHHGFTMVELVLPRLFLGQGRTLNLNRQRVRQLFA